MDTELLNYLAEEHLLGGLPITVILTGQVGIIAENSGNYRLVIVEP